MDRRSFIRASALGGTAAVATSLAAPAIAASHARTLTMVTTWGRGAAGVWDSVQRVADSVAAMSDGSLTIDVKAGGELVGAFEVFDAVTSGQADLYHGADYYFLGQHPGYAFFTGYPFGLTASETAAWYYHMGGKELHDELGQIFGLKSFLAGNTGTQAGGWFRKEINSPEDFQGLKFRMPGLGGQALGKLGASVQNIPGSEVYQALASGALDGTEWIGPWSDQAAGFQEITDIYYTSGFHEPGVALSLAVGRDVFEELSPAHQKIIEIAAAEAHQHTLTLYLSKNGTSLGQLQDQGVKTRQFSDEVWAAFADATKEVMDENMDDPLYAKIRESAEAARKAVSSWVSISEGSFVAQRDRLMS